MAAITNHSVYFSRRVWCFSDFSRFSSHPLQTHAVSVLLSYCTNDSDYSFRPRDREDMSLKILYSRFSRKLQVLIYLRMVIEIKLKTHSYIISEQINVFCPSVTVYIIIEIRIVNTKYTLQWSTNSNDLSTIGKLWCSLIQNL